MPKAVRFTRYGGPDVLELVDVDKPEPGDGEVVVRVVTAGVNPGEAKIRDGSMRDQFPRTSRKARAATWPGSSTRSGTG